MAGLFVFLLFALVLAGIQVGLAARLLIATSNDGKPHVRRASRFLSVAACALGAAVACGREGAGPTTPTAAQPASLRVTVDANPDGSTLKATAPTAQSPA